MLSIYLQQDQQKPIGVVEVNHNTNLKHVRGLMSKDKIPAPFHFQFVKDGAPITRKQETHFKADLFLSNGIVIKSLERTTEDLRGQSSKPGLLKKLQSKVSKEIGYEKNEVKEGSKEEVKASYERRTERDIYICYSSVDEEFAKKLEGAIEERGLICWRQKVDEKDKEKDKSEDTWQSLIDNSTAVAFIMTPDSLGTHRCTSQLFYAYENNKLIMPCVIKDVWEQLQGALRMLLQVSTWIDFTLQPFGVCIGKICDLVERVRNQNQEFGSMPANIARFLANMAHELRGPLSAIVNLAEVLANDENEKEEKEREKGNVNTSSSSSFIIANTIQDASHSLLGILDGVLDLTRLQSQELRLSPISFNLPLWLSSVVRLFAPKAWHQNIEIGVLIAPTCPKFIHSDPQRLAQILSNLVGNAIKFTDVGQVVIVVSRKTPNGEPVSKEIDDSKRMILEFRVIDSGIGMKKEDMAFLFQRFYQVLSFLFFSFLFFSFSKKKN